MQGDAFDQPNRIQQVAFFQLLQFASVLTLLCITQAAELTAEQPADQWVKPMALRPGDTIAIVAPSGPVDLEKVQIYAKSLEQAGYRVIVPEDLDRQWGYLAGPDDRRAEEINSMIRDPRVRAIFPARGGYGLTRILDRLDYQALRRDPKIIIGYSDITALHLAIAKKAKVVTFHSPVPMSNLYRGNVPEFAYADGLFHRAVFAGSYRQGEQGYLISGSPHSASQPIGSRAMVGGRATGRLMGGNLTLISSTLGTEFAIDTTDALLFLEDVDEAPYRVDRMLSQLRLSGALDCVAGVILGDFSHQNGETKDEMDAVLRDYFGESPVPVVWKFPIGHIPANATLPCGVWAELDTDSGSLQLLENPVRLE